MSDLDDALKKVNKFLNDNNHVSLSDIEASEIKMLFPHGGDPLFILGVVIGIRKKCKIKEVINELNNEYLDERLRNEISNLIDVGNSVKNVVDEIKRLIKEKNENKQEDLSVRIKSIRKATEENSISTGQNKKLGN